MEKKMDNNMNNQDKKILLAVTPFWDPLVPPQGIAALKGFLQKHGFNVRAVDTNVDNQFLEIYDRYFGVIKKYVPEDNWGNLHSIGHFVLQTQMMAHFNHSEDQADKYLELIKILVYKTFYTNFDDSQALELKALLTTFYSRLEKYFLDLVEKEKPAVIGVTVNTGTFPASLFVLRTVKKHHPHIKTIVGGSIFADQLAVGSPNYKYLLEESRDYIDKFILGQGELILLKYLQGELPDTQRVYTKKDVGGSMLTLKELEPPDLSDYTVSTYPYLAAAGSTSCKFQCSFCNASRYWGEFREKNPAQTASEMWQLYEEHRNQLFFMTDSMLNPIVDRLAGELQKYPAPLYYDAYFRVDKPSADIDNTLHWRRGGFYRARIGVETGSQRILDLIGKEITLEQTKATISALAYAGIKTTTYWVVGLPDETEEDFQQTLDLLEELRNDIWQAECAQFDYYYDGQAGSDGWAEKRMLLYPQWASPMIVSEAYILDCPPSREETYQRVYRFAQHCKKLGIPNPYSLRAINEADERWKRLHKNAVPGMLEFKSKDVINEAKNVKKFMTAQKEWKDEGDFGF